MGIWLCRAAKDTHETGHWINTNTVYNYFELEAHWNLLRWNPLQQTDWWLIPAVINVPQNWPTPMRRYLGKLSRHWRRSYIKYWPARSRGKSASINQWERRSRRCQQKQQTQLTSTPNAKERTYENAQQQKVVFDKPAPDAMEQNIYTNHEMRQNLIHGNEEREKGAKQEFFSYKNVKQNRRRKNPTKKHTNRTWRGKNAMQDRNNQEAHKVHGIKTCRS